MTIEELQAKYNLFVETGRKMKGHFNEHKKYGGSNSLNNYKKWRYKLFSLIDQEVKQQKSGQKELF